MSEPNKSRRQVAAFLLLLFGFSAIFYCLILIAHKLEAGRGLHVCGLMTRYTSGRHYRCLALGAQCSLLHGTAEGSASPFRTETADRPRSIPAVRQLSQCGLQESGNSLPVRF